MRPLVEGEARAAVEGLGEVPALEWLVATVDLLVHGERGVAGEVRAGLKALAHSAHA